MPAQHDQQTETNTEKSVGKDNFARKQDRSMEYIQSL